MALEVVDNPSESRYDLLRDGEPAGLMDYRRSDTALRIIHTEVFPEFQDHGVASEFVQTVLDRLRETDLRLQPDCPYVAHWLTTHENYQDLTRR
jgi:predicted GNAT family acetyltransferase